MRNWLPVLLLLGQVLPDGSYGKNNQERYEVTLAISQLQTDGKLSDCRNCDRHFRHLEACDVSAQSWMRLSNGWWRSGDFRGSSDQNWHSGQLVSHSFRGFGTMPDSADVVIDVKDRDSFGRREFMARLQAQLPVDSTSGTTTLRQYGGCGVSVLFSVHSRCLNGFVGPKCTCKNSAVHTCSADGRKVCLDNFFGPDCQFRRPPTTTTTTTTSPSTTASRIRMTDFRSQMRENCQFLQSRSAQDELSPICGRVKDSVALPSTANRMEATFGSNWPFLVPVVQLSRSGKYVFRCSAVLVHEHFLLTSAHCFKFQSGASASASASRLLAGADLFALVQTGRSTNVSVHIVDALFQSDFVDVDEQEEQRASDLDHNWKLLLLVLQKPVLHTPVCLLAPATTTTTTCLTHQWEQVRSAANETMRLQLMHGTETLQSKSVCLAEYNNREDETSDSEIMKSASANRSEIVCTDRATDDDGISNCNQLSGSLVCLHGEQWTLRGILPARATCDLALPEIYSDVAANRNWIQQSIKSYLCSQRFA